MKKGFYIKTFGCQMNEYDSSKINDLLESELKLRKVQTADDADLILVNTCSVRDKAQHKLFSELGRWKTLKNKNPRLLIGVGGCVASQEGEDIINKAPFVDLVFGPQTIHKLPQLIKKARRGSAAVDIDFPELEKFDKLPISNNVRSSSYVSIMEGCSKYCSFCVVPYTRGEEFSRPIGDVIKEIHSLVLKGSKEIILLGQNVNAYKVKDDKGRTIDLAALLHLISHLEGIERIRYTTSHPLVFSDRLINIYGEIPTLVNQVHLPVQSGSDRILSKMKRGYTALEYKAIISKLKKRAPSISITSDFIVGFPGETEDDFQKTLDLVKHVKFDQSFCFIYSPRPGTPATYLKDDTTEVEKKDRLARLQEILGNYSAHYSREMLGSVQEVLINGRSKKSDLVFSGRTENNRVVNFSGEESLIGTMVKMKITEVLPNSLRGELV